MNQWSLYGRLTQPLEDGCIYRGDWKDGKPEGKGRVEWPDGWVFEGRFLDGKPHGGDLRSPKMLVDQCSSHDLSTIKKASGGLSSIDKSP